MSASSQRFSVDTVCARDTASATITYLTTADPACSLVILIKSQRILQMHFKSCCHILICVLQALDSSVCETPVTRWIQRHRLFLVPWYKCFSSLVSDFYWIASHCVPVVTWNQLLLPITKSCSRGVCCPLFSCVCSNKTLGMPEKTDFFLNQKLSNYAN